tara:strand:+ start:881 stop:1108 length:228 start_codon:yes stop_codon:yes gene_type:complete
MSIKRKITRKKLKIQTIELYLSQTKDSELMQILFTCDLDKANRELYQLEQEQSWEEQTVNGLDPDQQCDLWRDSR